MCSENQNGKIEALFLIVPRLRVDQKAKFPKAIEDLSTLYSGSPASEN